MTMSEDWGSVCEEAQRVIDDQMFLREQGDRRGLRANQYETIRHVLRALAHAPGMIVAERTGQGKSLIAMAIMAALARVRAQTGAGPLRVGLLAPNRGVLTNWVGSESDRTCLLSGALHGPSTAPTCGRPSGCPGAWCVHGFRSKAPTRQHTSMCSRIILTLIFLM